MKNLQRIGGFAALIEAFAYIVGFVVMFAWLNPDNAESLTQKQKLNYLLNNKTAVQAVNLLIYVVFGGFLVVLATALHERLKAANPPLMQMATAFGLIWAGLVIASGMVANIGLDAVAKIYGTDPAQANSVWLSVAAVQNGLGGGVEVVGGLWVILISVTARGVFPKGLNLIGYLVGLAGVLTLIPGLSELGAVFGLGQIAWFIWLGIYLLKSAEA